MNILVTGATGYIGTRLTDALVGQGHAVSALSRDAERAQRQLPQLQQAHQWRPAEVAPSPDVFEDIEAVVHLAGERLPIGHVTAGRARSLGATRLTVLQRLIEGIEQAADRPRTLVVAGAVGYYGDHGDDPLVEDDPPGDSLLSRGLVEYESEAMRAGRHGLKVAVVRNGLVIGPGKGCGFLDANLPLYRMGLGGPMGSGRQWWPWVHVDDVVGIQILALHGDLEGPVNATTPEPVRQKEFARTLGRAVRRPAFMPAPGFMVRLIAGQVAGEVLGSKRVMPRRALESGYEFRFPVLEPALTDALSS
jgi:uncharacterized protein (TIGR01777 family)